MSKSDQLHFLPRRLLLALVSLPDTSIPFVCFVSSNEVISCRTKKFDYVSLGAGMNQICDVSGDGSLVCKDPDPQTREIFLPFRCFCTRKDVSFLP